MEKTPHIESSNTVENRADTFRRCNLKTKQKPTKITPTNKNQLKPHQPRVKKIWDLSTEPHLQLSSCGSSAGLPEDFQQQHSLT